VDIYTASTAVASQSEAERNRAAQDTLGEVVVRVSGQASALANPQVQQALSRAPNYLYGFSYSTSSQAPGAGSQPTNDAAAGDVGMVVQLNFSPEAIQQLLRDAGLPLWPAQRPRILVWLLSQDATGIHLETNSAVLDALRQQARYRGLPLVFPNEDAAQQWLGSLWQFDAQTLAEASKAYRADAILLGRYTDNLAQGVPSALYTTADSDPLGGAELVVAPLASSPESGVAPAEQSMPTGPWQLDWQFIRDDKHLGEARQVADLAIEFSTEVDRLADTLAREYAIIPSAQGPQTLSLHVGGVQDFASFKRIQSYLSGLAMVKQAELEKVDASGMTLQLTIEGDLKLLISTLALGRKLQPENPQVLLDVLNGSAGSTGPALTAADPQVLDEKAMAAELDKAIAADADPQTSSVNADVATSTTSTGEVEPALVPLGSRANPLAYFWKP